MSHAADVIIEAWGGTPVECLEEAARALVETFADVNKVTASDTVPVMFDVAPDDEEALVAVLEEIVYLVDAHEAVPVDVALEATDDGGVAGYFETAAASTIALGGAAPKCVSRSELELGHDQGGWRCRAVIDVSGSSANGPFVTDHAGRSPLDAHLRDRHGDARRCTMSFERMVAV